MRFWEVDVGFATLIGNLVVTVRAEDAATANRIVKAAYPHSVYVCVIGESPNAHNARR